MKNITLYPENLILGFVANYSIGELRPFIHSLKKSNYSGRVAFICHNIDDNTQRWLIEQNISAIMLDENCPAPEKLSYILYRNQAYYDFLSKPGIRAKIKNVFITDVRDVFFQADPFIDAVTPFEKGLYVFAESKIFKNDQKHNGPWVSYKYGQDILDSFAQKNVYCAGTVSGDIDSALIYLEAMLEEQSVEESIVATRHAQLNSIHYAGIDQGIHNYLIHTGKLERKLGDKPLHLCENSKSTVLTCDGVYLHNVDMRTGLIHNADHSFPAVLHQYERHPLLPEILFYTMNIWATENPSLRDTPFPAHL